MLARRRRPTHRPPGAANAKPPFAGRPKASPSKRGYGRDWQRLRRLKLQADPLCAFHLERGETVAAEVVDHRQPISEAPELRLAWENLRSLCKECHDAHTLRQVSAAVRPRGLRPSAVPLTVVAQPGGNRPPNNPGAPRDSRAPTARPSAFHAGYLRVARRRA